MWCICSHIHNFFYSVLSVMCYCPHFRTLKSQPWEVLTVAISEGCWGRCEGLTDCHQCEAGLLIALVYNFSHGHTATLGGWRQKEVMYNHSGAGAPRFILLSLSCIYHFDACVRGHQIKTVWMWRRGSLSVIATLVYLLGSVVQLQALTNREWSIASLIVKSRLYKVLSRLEKKWRFWMWFSAVQIKVHWLTDWLIVKKKKGERLGGSNKCFIQWSTIRRVRI